MVDWWPATVGVFESSFFAAEVCLPGSVLLYRVEVRDTVLGTSLKGPVSVPTTCRRKSDIVAMQCLLMMNMVVSIGR
jgi:hypothetical protein